LSLQEDDFVAACVTSDNTEAFLRRVNLISKPKTGVGRILHFFARLALCNHVQVRLEDEYEVLSIQVLRGQENDGSFVIRLVSFAGLDSDILFKVEVNCEFDELLEAARDSKNIAPFTCTKAGGDFLHLEVPENVAKNSLPPSTYLEADARIRELEANDMFQTSRWVPTIPAPEDDDPAADLAYAVVKPSNLPSIREEQPSWADQAFELSQQAPSIPTEPIPAEDSVRNGIATTIGRLSLVRKQVPADTTIAHRPATQRPPSINEEADEMISIPPLPLITADKDKL